MWSPEENEHVHRCSLDERDVAVAEKARPAEAGCASSSLDPTRGGMCLHGSGVRRTSERLLGTPTRQRAAVDSAVHSNGIEEGVNCR
jgi:hypothetical protein